MTIKKNPPTHCLRTAHTIYKTWKIGQHSISKNEKTVYLSNKNICEHYDEFKNTFKYEDNYLKNN
jgi:hypothetical protein